MKEIKGGVAAPLGFTAAGIHCGVKDNSGKLKLGMTYTVMGYFMSRYYTRFRKTYPHIRLHIRQSSATEAEFDFVGTGKTLGGQVLTNGLQGKVALRGNRGHFGAEDCQLAFYRHEHGEVSIDQKGGCDLGAYVMIGHDFRRMATRTPLFEWQALFGEFL